MLIQCKNIYKEDKPWRLVFFILLIHSILQRFLRSSYSQLPYITTSDEVIFFLSSSLWPLCEPPPPPLGSLVHPRRLNPKVPLSTCWHFSTSRSRLLRDPVSMSLSGRHLNWESSFVICDSQFHKRTPFEDMKGSFQANENTTHFLFKVFIIILNTCLKKWFLINACNPFFHFSFWDSMLWQRQGVASLSGKCCLLYCTILPR